LQQRPAIHGNTRQCTLKRTATNCNTHPKKIEAADFAANTSALVVMGFDYKDATAALAGCIACEL